MRLPLALFAPLALVGCSDRAPEESDAQPADPAAASVAEINAQPVTPSEGEIELTPLSADARGALDAAGRTCAFAYQGRTLLWAGEGMQGLQGKLVADGRVIDLEGPAAALDAGATLGDGNLTAQVQRAEGSPESIAQGDRWPADLVLSSSQGEAKFSPGTWTCSS